MKKFASLLLCLVMAVTSFSFMACTPEVPDTPETLEIYCWDAGYGTQWCIDMVEEFKKQDWVKEKYPNLIIPAVTTNDVSNFAESKLNAGQKANSFDLIFGANLQSFAGPNGQFLELTDLVYNSTVPGENVKWIDKAFDSYNRSNKYIDVTDLSSETYYLTSWAGGMNSIIYNEDTLNDFGIKVPNTTDEFIAACATIMANKGADNGKYNEGYSIVQAKDAIGYLKYLFPIWWAQYEGVDNYFNFWNGIDDNRYSKNIFLQEGREHALSVYEELLDYDKGYFTPSSFTWEFMQSQTLFLQGHGVFHVNGDWFDNEMRAIANEIKATSGIDTFKTMRVPIISELGVKLGITDAQLSEIVDYVDGATATQPAFTSTTDYSNDEVIAAVREARTVVGSIGPNHTSAIPSYANGKDVAVDFLRFMATDIAIESYIKSTGGASLPFKYNLKEKNSALYDTLNPLQQSRLDYFGTDKYEVFTLPADYAFPLAKYGGLKAFIKDDYHTVFASAGNKKTPKDFMDETLEAWNDTKWNMALANAGIAN